jgi:hypothetical protein
VRRLSNSAAVLLLSLACVGVIFGFQLATTPDPNSREGFERRTGLELCSTASVERVRSQTVGLDVIYEARLTMPEDYARRLYASVTTIGDTKPCGFPHCMVDVEGGSITINRLELLGGSIAYDFTWVS